MRKLTAAQAEEIKAQLAKGVSAVLFCQLRQLFIRRAFFRSRRNKPKQ
jgi:hypothetical protein